MRRIDQPEPGTYRIRQVKGGPWLGAIIWRPCLCTINGPAQHHWTSTCDRYPPLQADIDGFEAEVERVWTYGRSIGRHEYDFLRETTANQPIVYVNVRTAPNF